MQFTTMNIEERLKTKREEILETAARYGAYNVRIFGSVARGRADSESDVDLSGGNGSGAQFARSGWVADGVTGIAGLSS